MMLTAKSDNIITSFLFCSCAAKNSMTHLNDRVEVNIDNFVQVARNDFGDFVQSLEVVRAVGLIHEGGKVKGRQIAHSDLLRKVRERERNC